MTVKNLIFLFFHSYKLLIFHLTTNQKQYLQRKNSYTPTYCITLISPGFTLSDQDSPKLLPKSPYNLTCQREKGEKCFSAFFIDVTIESPNYTENAKTTQTHPCGVHSHTGLCLTVWYCPLGKVYWEITQNVMLNDKDKQS